MPYVLFEAGEALRIEPPAVTFVKRVMRNVKILRKKSRDWEHLSAYCMNSSWRRATLVGLFWFFVPLGKAVEEGQMLGLMGDPFGDDETEVVLDRQRVVIDQTCASFFDESDALFHIAQSQASSQKAEERIFLTSEEVLPDVERPTYRDSHFDQ